MQVKEEMEYDDVEGTFFSTSTLHYTARLEDANSSLVCSMLQTDKQGVLLYRQEASLTLDVVSPPPPVVTASSTSLSGLILGSSVGALFVLLLVFLLTFVLCRIRRQKRKEPSPDPCPPPHNQPTVWTSNCSSNWTCQQREMTATSSFEASNSISSNSSSSFQTNRSLGDLPTLTTLHGMRPPSSPLGLHHHILSCRSSFCNDIDFLLKISCLMYRVTLSLSLAADPFLRVDLEVFQLLQAEQHQHLEFLSIRCPYPTHPPRLVRAPDRPFMTVTTNALVTSTLSTVVMPRTQRRVRWQTMTTSGVCLGW